ncbi:DUF1656 domain-containing protein [Paraburkholderia bengalensis]|uniref:DUF1656 domain-containing protein n=1 Tax=Paraburkholderia bengalensis TaxID=2747562 RepID=A0ABU8IVS1_9BURK
MIEEIHILGVYMPAGLAWAVIAVMITAAVRRPLHRLPFHLLLWHPGLIELALFLVLWWSISRLADAYLPHGFIT